MYIRSILHPVVDMRGERWICAPGSSVDTSSTAVSRLMFDDTCNQAALRMYVPFRYMLFVRELVFKNSRHPCAHGVVEF